MTTDQIAQLDLIIARISFYKSAAQLFQNFLNQEWPVIPAASLTGKLISDDRTLESFKRVLSGFGDFYFSKAIEAELELKRKRFEFEQTAQNSII